MEEVGSVDAEEKAALRAARAWGLDAVRIRGDLSVCGSPRRSELRCVVECSDERLVILQAVRGKDREHKQAVIDRLDALSRQGLSRIHPCLQASDGRHMIQIEDLFWQASPFVDGIPLERPGYEFDRWRGEAMADFLIDLRTASRNLPDGLSTTPFSIPDFIDALMGKVGVREPELADRLRPAAVLLQKRLYRVHGLLPAAFCHGDYHPLNMIWSDTALLGVIDWEFSGTKPDNYDAATLIGCMGMETPDALTGPLVTAFIRNLKAANFLSETGWRVLVEMIIAIRFAWLSEWLRNRDTEMIELETVYLHLLTDHADDLAALWQCSPA